MGICSSSKQSQLSWLVLLIVIMTFSSYRKVGAAQSEATSTVSIVVEAINNDQVTMAIQVIVAESASYGAGSFTISYPASDLSPVSCDLVEGLMGFCNLTDEQDGVDLDTIRLSAISAEPLTGTIRLGTLIFNRLNPSGRTTQVDVETITFADSEGIEHAINSIGGAAAWGTTAVNLVQVNTSTPSFARNQILVYFSILSLITLGLIYSRYSVDAG